MIIGVPKEIKNNENRVGMTPSGVAEVVKCGHTAYSRYQQRLSGRGIHSRGCTDSADNGRSLCHCRNDCESEGADSS